MDQTFIYLILWAGFFAVIFAVLIKRGWVLGGAGAKGRVDKSFVSRKWQEIEALMQQQKPSSYKVAILDADKLVDYVLKTKVGTDGNMGERLKKSQKLFSSYQNYNNLWEAHKMRNRVAHEADHELHFAEAKKNIGYFKKALRDLGAM